MWHRKQAQLDELVGSRRLIKINGRTCGKCWKDSFRGLTCCYRNVYVHVLPHRGFAARFIAYRWKEKLLVKRSRCSDIPKQRPEWIKKEAHKGRSIWVSRESGLTKPALQDVNFIRIWMTLKNWVYTTPWIQGRKSIENSKLKEIPATKNRLTLKAITIHTHARALPFSVRPRKKKHPYSFPFTAVGTHPVFQADKAAMRGLHLIAYRVPRISITSRPLALYQEPMHGWPDDGLRADWFEINLVKGTEFAYGVVVSVHILTLKSVIRVTVARARNKPEFMVTVWPLARRVSLAECTLLNAVVICRFPIVNHVLKPCDSSVTLK